MWDKRLVIAAVVERVTLNEGVRGRAIVDNRPEDRVVTTWRRKPDTTAT